VVILAWALYVVLEPVNRHLALLALLLRLAENAIAAATIFPDFVALRLLRTNASQAFESNQLQELARTFIGGHPVGLQIAFVFVGFGTAIFSYLWLKSHYIPRALAILGIVGSLMLAIVGLAIMVFPSLGSLGLTYMIPLGLYEVGLGLWLLIKGIHA
jgi:hypothetical protein